eukprot:GSChrysophyteH2.ASY1.ANO1.1335.1 assembled CDS
MSLYAEEGGQLLRNFITNTIDADLRAASNGGRIVTRFPPEPNGYLHLGHAKSICVNFGIASAYGGVTHMRFDDTNPAKENMEYATSIIEDVKWLVGNSEDGVEPWYGDVCHASDYFGRFYEAAELLVQKGLAYVDHQSMEELRANRGTLTQPGTNSRYRNRSVEENLQLFRGMQSGKFSDGACVLRAKIDMSSPNMNMRDPTLYRIKRSTHPITGDQWVIYPMYDFAHALSDALEGITHSLCTLEFEDHRPLYDWVITHVSGWRPVQTEFARLNLQYTVLSKRKLVQLVQLAHVNGWDDPRMPTLSGVRRRGYPPDAIRKFCDRLGVSKAENNIDIAILEECVRESLNETAPRALAVLDPLQVTITNWPKDEEEIFMVEQHPNIPEMGKRNLPFSESIYIDRNDFHDTALGGTARLKYAYVITCNEIIRDHMGNPVELLCSYDPVTRAGQAPEGSTRAKGIIQWVSKDHNTPVEVIQYDRLFMSPSPGKGHPEEDFLLDLNPNSLTRCQYALAEPSVGNASPGQSFQFERLGYFCRDIQKSTTDFNEKPIFNRIVTLRDTWNNHIDRTDTNTNKKLKKQQVGGNNKKEKASAPAVVADVLRVDMRVGRILTAEKHPDADSLFVETIDIGDENGPRTVISGLAGHVSLESLPGRLVVVLCNLKPVKMRGILSEGMILAASDEENKFVELLNPPSDASAGDIVQIEGYGEPQPDEQLKSKSAQKVWERVASQLQTATDATCTAMYQGKPLVTSTGTCSVASLRGASIR